MAKRFGRNQRRKLREAVKAATFEAHRQQFMRERETSTLRDQNRELRDHNGEYETRLRYVERALSRFGFTALLPTTSFHAPRRMAPREVGRIHIDNITLDAPSSNVSSERHDEPLTVAELTHIVTSIERCGIQGKVLAHVFIEGHGAYQGHWTYAATDRALSMGIPEDAAARLALDIAERLLLAANDHVTNRDAKAALARVMRKS